MALVLVNPRTTRLDTRELFSREPPTGLLLLAAVLENAGNEISICDLEGSPNPKEELWEFAQNPEQLGFTFLTPSFPEVVDLAKTIWEERPNLKIMAGGPHASFMPEECFTRIPGLSAVMIGEGESQVVQLCNVLRLPENQRTPQNFTAVPGIAFKDGAGNIITTAPPSPVDVSTLPLPARHLLPPKYNIASVIVNRGCPNQCSFCTRQALFRTTRVRPVASVLEELAQIQNLPNYEYVNFYDNVNVYHEYVQELCRGMEKMHFHLPWGAELRIDRLDESLARKMKKQNCRGIATGVETANEALLRANGKVQRLEEVMVGLEAAIAADLTVQAYFVLGLPGETQETFQETISFIESSPLRPGRDIVDFFPATPYPGSRLWEQRAQLKWNLLDPDYAHWDCHHLVMCPASLTPADLRKMAHLAKRVARKYKAGA